jgi:signal transduction histidine kinase
VEDPADLLRTVRILERKLARAETNLRRLEDQREASVALHVNVVHSLEASQRELERKNRELQALTQELEHSIDELTATQECLAASERLATQASVAKSTFLANMSHELRTPLNAIIGYAELVEEDLLGTGLCGEELRRIRQAGAHLLALIDQILDLSKVEAGRMQIDWSDVDVAALVDSLVATFRPTIQRKGLDLSVHVERMPPLRTDRQKLTQILINLVSNAVKFTHSGAVTVEAWPRDERAWFAVSDTGVGMAADQLARVFQPFEQADPSTTRRYGGTGLGLAISDRYCSLLGGQLVAHSTVDVGSRFEFSIPLPMAEPVS